MQITSGTSLKTARFKNGFGEYSYPGEDEFRGMADDVVVFLKRRDFEHLLFQQDNSRRILQFPEFIRTLSMR